MTARPSRTLRAIAAVVGLLPWTWLRPLGAVLAFIAFDLLRIRRGHVIASLARAGLGDVATARGVFVELGASALELLWISARRGTPVGPLVRVLGWERFAEVAARGRGVIVATAHTGNWDLAACACASRTPLAVITKRLSSPSIDAFWQQTRAARGVDLLPAPDGNVLAAARDRLARGGAVAVLVDQDPERITSVVEAQFLGELAVHDTVAATLSARTGAPIVITCARRDRDGHVVEVLDVLEPPTRADRAYIDAATRTIAARIDEFVRASPTAWLWLHRRWKTRLTAR